jgi:hypothetical protein
MCSAHNLHVRMKTVKKSPRTSPKKDGHLDLKDNYSRNQPPRAMLLVTAQSLPARVRPCCERGRMQHYANDGEHRQLAEKATATLPPVCVVK